MISNTTDVKKNPTIGTIFSETLKLIDVLRKYEKFMERNGLHRAAGKIRDEVFRR